MTKMKYSTLIELQEKEGIQPNQRKQLHQWTCERAFESYLSIYKAAVRADADPEGQYILYYRCGEIGKMIMQKNGFRTFTQKKELGDTFKILLQKMDNLESVLTKKYENSRKETPPPVVTACETKENTIPELPPPQPKSHVSIKARDLIRLVENEKKSAIIIDYRSNQAECGILYKKSSINPLQVISIPRDLIKPGLLFSALKHQLQVGQRPLLNKIMGFDYVVLMDSSSVHLLNDEPIPSTEAGILKLALTEYNQHDKLKSAPLFMEGGFESWTLQYPMYVNNLGQSAGDQIVDSLGKVIAGYKRATFPDFPELSPKKVAKHPEPPAPPPENVFEAPAEPIKEVQSPPQIPVQDIPEAIIEPKHASPVEIAPKVHPVPERPPKPAEFKSSDQDVATSSNLPRLAGGQSAVAIKKPSVDNNIGDMRISLTSVENKPTFSRADKPGDVPRKPSLTKTEKAVTPRVITSLPALDRSTKPSITISAEDQHTLLQIYNLMAENIRENAVTGSNPPGQTGLYNMGNTCFMSACLQALFQTPILVKIFSGDNFIKRVNMHNRLGSRGVISAIFSALVDNVWSGHFRAFKPKRFLTLFAKEVNEMLMNGEQQDASEFYMLLLGTLHEDTSEVVKAIPPVQNYTGGDSIRREAADFDRLQLQFSCSPISRLMHPRTVAEVTCSACRKKSIKFEDINIIQVGLPSPSMGRASLIDCLHNSFSVTSLDGLWDCPHCKVPRSATQKLSLWKLPGVMVIHLLRFSFLGGDYVKNDIPVMFDPENLDMSAFLHPAADRHADTSYRLYSVTNHRGRLNSGHYTANCRHLWSREWLRFDDESVSRAAVGDINYSDAYILYFKKKNLEE